MVPCSTTHFSAPLFFQPVKSFPLKRETHPLCTEDCATTAAPNNTAAARIAPILFTVGTSISAYARIRGLGRKKLTTNMMELQPVPSFGPVALRRRLDSHSSIRLARFQVSYAKLRQVALVALINLLQREIRVIDFVLPRHHVFRVIRPVTNSQASLLNAQPEFPPSGLIIH